MSMYQALFILRDSLNEEALTKMVEQIKADIGRHEGTVADAQIQGLRAFARPLRKRRAGVYVKILFEVDASHMAALQARYRLNESIFRFQITRAVRKPVEKTEEKKAEAQPVAAGG